MSRLRPTCDPLAFSSFFSSLFSQPQRPVANPPRPLETTFCHPQRRDTCSRKTPRRSPQRPMRRKPQSRDSTPRSPFGPVSYWPNNVRLGAWVTIFHLRLHSSHSSHLSTHPLCSSQSSPSTSLVRSATQRRNSGPHASSSSSSPCSSSLPSSSTAAAAPRAARTAGM
jgi:hypothetical protein